MDVPSRRRAQFESASASKLDKGEMVLTVRYGSDARAYPIREMAYHHVLNDVVGRRPGGGHLLNALSHRSGVDANGKRQSLAFLSCRNQQPEFPDARQRNRHLVAADHRQSHLRPVEGAALELVLSDELTFGEWKSEVPDGKVLREVPKYGKEYDSNWEPEVAKLPVVISFPGTELKSRDVVVGLELDGASRAYPWDTW